MELCYRLSQLMSRFDEVRSSGDMMPTAVLTLGTTHEGRKQKIIFAQVFSEFPFLPRDV